MQKLLFGSAGIPLSTKKRNTLNGISECKQLGLGAMELEFVRSINISKEKAPEVKAQAKKEGIVLTCHAPHYINLNAQEREKLEASKKRILNSARIAEACGAYSVCYHPAYFMKQDPKKVYEKVKKQIQDIMKTLKKEGVKIYVRPETTGKHSAFGSFEECVKISKEIPGVLPCVDFAHLHARANGGMNTYKEFCEALTYMEKHLGKQGIKKMHIHYSGIRYSDKGELNHLNLKQSDGNYKDLMKALKKFKAAGVLISESPSIEKDALLMQKAYSK